MFIQKEQTTLGYIKVPTARLILNAAEGEREDTMQQGFFKSFSVSPATSFITFFIGHT